MRQLALALAMTIVAGCSAATPSSQTTATAEPAPVLRAPYFLQPGDVVSVKFYNNPELNEDLVVRPDGMVSLQLIGEVQAAGLTPSALSTALTERYAGELAVPAVNVIVRQLGSQRVYLGGEVGKPGAVELTFGLTLFQAVQEAGGFLNSAHRAQVVLIRRSIDGRASGYAIDTRDIANGEAPWEDVLLEPQDIVYVPKSKIANINMWVDQYIRQNLPIQFAIPLF